VQHEVDPEALQAVGALVAAPVLQAAHRRWRAAVPKSWGKGYCPVCGSWPAFAETRGIERNRYLRCARCGAEWFAQLLQCAFCDTRDHGELVSLIPEAGGTPEGIEACRRCRGYIKVFTRLQGCAPAAVMLEDLASVHLDLAALREGYSRPQGAGMAVDVTVNPMSAAKRRFAWNL
jgi:FdhE protein